MMEEDNPLLVTLVHQRKFLLDHLMPDDWREADDAVTDEMIERSANA